MTFSAATAQELITQLNADRKELIAQHNADRNQYLESFNKATELLLQVIASTGGISHDLPSRLTHQRLNADPLRRNTLPVLDVEQIEGFHGTNSTYSAEEDSSSEDGSSLYADSPLQPEDYDTDGLRDHIRDYPWTDAGRRILTGVVGNEKLLKRPELFPTDLDTSDDRSHFTHSTIYNVGEDGMYYNPIFEGRRVSRSLEIWNRIKSVNASENDKAAVGKIIHVREPSPLLFAALHYTMNKHFDMDELFGFLIDHDPVLARPHNPFSDNHRKRRTFVFNMEYFTLIGENCVPMSWQRFDSKMTAAETHIPISRCSATVALSLEGDPVSMVKNKDRRVNKKYGHVHDPFSPWRVLAIQAYPDWESTIEDVDEDTRQRRHVVNGPEAFLTVLRQEFRDAAKRLLKVYRRIEDLVEVPHDFIFRLETRDQLLFEDDEFTYSRRYFWAGQTLSIMSIDIRDMIHSYRDTFHDGIWDGTDKIVWPGSSQDMSSSRHLNWRKRMALLRGDIERDIRRLEEIELMNEKKIRAINGLRDNLFSGTSVMESRRSVQMAEAAILQGNNIRTLTLVTIFFLPLTFVTSVYGMTNMPPNDPFYHFAWTTIAVCLPTYILIFVLTPGTFAGWRRIAKQAYLLPGRWSATLLDILFGYKPRWAETYGSQGSSPVEPQVPVQPRRPSKSRTGSTEVAMALRAATGTAATILSPALSRSMSREDQKPEKRPLPYPTSSPTANSIRFDFDNTPQKQPPRAGFDEEVSPITPVRSGVRSGAPANEKHGSRATQREKMNRDARSRSFRDVFASRQGDRGERVGQPDLV